MTMHESKNTIRNIENEEKVMLIRFQGLRTIQPMPGPEDVIKEMLKYLLDPSDTDRAFVKFNPNDNVVMLVNNFGGLSNLEFDAMVNLALIALKRDWSIEPTRIYAGVLETSLNAQGFSITLGNMTGMANSMGVKVEEVIALLDAPTNAPAWPKNGFKPVNINKETEDLRNKANAALIFDLDPGPIAIVDFEPELRDAGRFVKQGEILRDGADVVPEGGDVAVVLCEGDHVAAVAELDLVRVVRFARAICPRKFDGPRGALCHIPELCRLSLR